MKSREVQLLKLTSQRDTQRIPLYGGYYTLPLHDATLVGSCGFLVWQYSSNINSFSNSRSQFHCDIAISMDLGDNIGTFCEAPKFIWFVSLFEYTLSLDIVIATAPYICSMEALVN